MKRLLVALDTSDNSTFVLARAVEIADALDAKVRLLTVAHMPPVVPAPPGGLVYVEPSAVIRAAEEMLRVRERDLPAGLRDGLVVELGDVCTAICNVARSYDADLVVIGAHRHGVVGRMLGTTAARVVNHIDRSLLVVRPMQSTRDAR